MTITENKYKVLIPTAGTGERLKDLTKYLNKSLVSIANKPVLSRIIDMFPENCEFVIALGYKGDLVKQYLSLAHPDRVFYFSTVEKFEGEGSGLGLSILSCEKYLDCSFVFCSCDTLIKEHIAFPDKNIVFYGERNNINQYRTVEIQDNKAVKFYEKGLASKTAKPYIGLACIYDYKKFWTNMHNGGQIAIDTGESYVLSIFAQENNLYAQNVTWFDTGNLEEFENTQKYFNSEATVNILPKPDEAIWFVNNKVIKFSHNKKFIKDRVERVKYLKGFVPEIVDFTENMYCYNKQEGTVLSKSANIGVFKKLLNYSLKFWGKVRKDNQFDEICNNFYRKKTIDRINLYYKNLSMEDKTTVINGKSLPKLSEILDKLDWQNITQGLIGRFHGDFHFENILYDNKNDKFLFLDWRQNFGGRLDFGDIYYDLAKLLHGLIICHELIAQNKYSVEINENIVNYSFERKPVLVHCEEYFYLWLKENNFDIKKVKQLCALIYLNIAPLHHYPYCHLLYFLGKNMLYENI